MTTPPKPIPGLLTHYPRPPSSSSTYPLFLSGDISSTRVLIWIGGLYNYIGDIAYAGALSEEGVKGGWGVAYPHLSSSGIHFGTSSVHHDALEIAAVVTHLQSTGKSKIALMGHSTGCQSLLTYLLTPTSPPIQGAIFQAPVSDREAFTGPAASALATEAQKMVDEGRGEELLDKEMVGEVLEGVERLTGYRGWSLLCKGGDEDYFSSDIPLHPTPDWPHPTLSTTFPHLPPSIPFLFIHSGADQYMPPEISKPALLARWAEACALTPGVDFRGVVVEGAGHGYEDGVGVGRLMSEVAGVMGGL